MTADLRLGRWQDVLADVTCDALISDPPYGVSTHDGHRRGTFDAHGSCERRDINYAAWSKDDVSEFVASWSPRTRGWFVAFTSHDLAHHYAVELERAGRYVFAPLPWVHIGGRIRLSGDGPSSWTCWIVVARPKTRDMQRWGTLPGAGGGTTLLAALAEGRRAVGSECMPEHYEIARKRLDKGFTPPLFQAEAPPQLNQPDLFGTEE